MTEPQTISPVVDRFRELIDGSDADDEVNRFLEELRAVDVVVYPDHRCWELIVDVDLDEKPTSELQTRFLQRFQQELDELQDLQLTYRPGSDQSLVDWLDDNWSSLKQFLGRLTPAGGSMLEYARTEHVENQLIFELAEDRLVSLCQSRNLHDRIQNWIEERYGSCPPVRFKVGDFSEKIEADAISFREETRREIEEEQRRREHRAKKRQEKIIFGDLIESEPTALSDLPDPHGKPVTVEGRIIENDLMKTSSNKKNLIIGVLTDRTDSIGYKLFIEGTDEDLTGLEDEWVKLKGDLKRDNYSRARDPVIFVESINRRPPMIRDDTSEEKRVELHCHSRMSQLDGLYDVEDLVQRAAYWNHPALAITDHGVVHSFPDAARAAEKYGVKLIYGVEGYLVQDQRPLVLNVSDVHAERNLAEKYVVLDCATTGPNPHEDSIFHLCASRVMDGEIVDTFDRVIRRESLSESVLEQTELTREEVREGADSASTFEEFAEFLGDSVVVTLEADTIRHFLEAAGVSLAGPVVHLRRLYEGVRGPSKYGEGRTVEDRLETPLENGFDPEVSVKQQQNIFRELRDELPEPLTLERLRTFEENSDYRGQSNHIILLAVNRKGLRNLYRLISHSHIYHFYRNPRMLRSKIDENRVGLLVGSACEAGEIFQAAVKGESDEEIQERMKFYNFLEIQPVENNRFMLEEGGIYQNITSEDDLREINRRIYRLAHELDKPVVGTGDVHFVDREDEIFRLILQNAQDYEDADNQPPLYYRTTGEMLDRFAYLGQETAREVVIKNPRQIAETCDRIDPIPDGFHPPDVENANEIFKDRISRRLRDLYGSDLPEPVSSRAEDERSSIIENEFANLYVTAAKLVDRSREDGYLVGSRGSVGSSFTAYLMGITEVNPLPPHYRCDHCQYVLFPDDTEADCGVDLPAETCPDCGKEMNREGFEIPFEVFCGFEGEKIPDIDLNFSGDYQQTMFDYVEELFGEENVFRAGTIDTVADKTAASFVNEYLEERDLHRREAEYTRLVNGLTGVKQNTSQHPGGMVIVPEDRSVYEFTPINLPANDEDARFQTTHFDYHAMEEQLVKLDVLGHDDPTQLRYLQELTGVDPREIPLNDEKTMKLFSDISVLGLEPEDMGMQTGVLGVPEFNTNFVRGMVEETRPECFADLVRISGLSHGEQVWRDNAQDLIQSGTAGLEEVISARDDIMNRLIDSGVPDRDAFRIMEDVRKGEGLSNEQIRKMKAQNVPDWYVESCKRISYLFPKAHAAAYVIMAFRIAYFKVHYPEEFYASYFTLKTSSINARHIGSYDDVVSRMNRIESLMNQDRENPRDRQEYSILEVFKEAYLRGVSIETPKLSHSSTDRFTVKDGTVLQAPYVTMKGLGPRVAETIDRALEERDFSSVEDVKNRTGITKNVIEEGHQVGFFEDLPEEDNYGLFE